MQLSSGRRSTDPRAKSVQALQIDSRTGPPSGPVEKYCVTGQTWMKCKNEVVHSVLLGRRKAEAGQDHDVLPSFL